MKSHNPEKLMWNYCGAPVIEHGGRPKIEVNADGKIYRIMKRGWRRRGDYVRKDGYCAVMCMYGEVKIVCMAHRLVWQAFRGDIPEGMEINHKDMRKKNNKLDNLELVTHSQNIRHAIGKRGWWLKVKRGENHPRAKLTMEQVREIRAAYVPHPVKYSKHVALSMTEIARRYGVSQVAISKIIAGKTYKE